MDNQAEDDHRSSVIVACAAESASARRPATADTVRYPFEIRWGRERGWLRVRDCLTGEWHEVEARQAPESWRREANERRGRTGWR